MMRISMLMKRVEECRVVVGGSPRVDKLLRGSRVLYGRMWMVNETVWYNYMQAVVVPVKEMTQGVFLPML